MEQGYKDNGAGEDDQDGKHEFSRVQIMCASTDLLDPGDGHFETSSPRLLAIDLNDPEPTYLPLLDEPGFRCINPSLLSFGPSRDKFHERLTDYEPPSILKAYMDPASGSFSDPIASGGVPRSFPGELDHSQSYFDFIINESPSADVWGFSYKE